MKELSDYIIKGKLGNQSRRAFGTVYEATCRESNQRVVIKVVEHAAAGQRAIDAIRNEASFNFSEKGLPRVIQFTESDDVSILVSHFEAGIPLLDYWNQLSSKKRTEYVHPFIERLGEKLEYLHRQEIYHLDVKPSNILIDPETQELKLIDFGLAIREPLTTSRTLIFPLGYAAPELVLHKLHLVNRTSDYFSVGVLLWRLFCGALPLQHPNPSIYTNLQIAHPLPDHEKLPKGLHPVLTKLCAKPHFRTAPNRMPYPEVENALLAAQNNRYQYTQELLDDLKQIRHRRFGLF